MNPDITIIDTHAHLNDPKFAADLDNVIARANDAGVGRIIVPGYDMPSSRAAVELAKRYECIFATVGVHPHDARNYDDEVADELIKLAQCAKVVAIGEIGLDFHYDFSPRPDQRRAFELQIDLAANLKLPIVIHSRESNSEVMQVLETRMSNIVGGVFHFFSGDCDFARRVLDAGFYIGADGPITYKSSEDQRKVVEMCPSDRLLVETDCPYLSPVPYRGKRNEPAYVRYVLEEVARVKGMTVEELAEITTRNAKALFGNGL
ncbi:MAG: TatD family hydrolase [Armatimonadota bacterium]|nr:TatD family hydrolase [bacterium]